MKLDDLNSEQAWRFVRWLAEQQLAFELKKYDVVTEAEKLISLDTEIHES